MEEHTGSRRAYWETLLRWAGLLCQAVWLEREEEAGERAAVLRRRAQAQWEEQDRLGRRAAQAGELLPLPYLFAAMKLETFACQCLVLALLPEADRAFEQEYARLEPEAGGALTAALALELCGSRTAGWDGCLRALAPDGPLTAFCLGEGGRSGRARLSRILEPARRVTAFVLEERWEDPETAGLSLSLPGEEAWPWAAALAGRMEAFANAAPAGEGTAFLLWGQPGAGRRTLARAMAARQGRPLVMAEGWRLLGEEGRPFFSAALREAAIQQCPLCWTGLEEAADAAGSDSEAEEFLLELLEKSTRVCGVGFLLGRGGWTPGRAGANFRLVSIPLPAPEVEESRLLWQRLLEGRCPSEAVDVERLAGKYRLTPGQMERAAAEAAALARWEGREELSEGDLERGCRMQLRHRLGEKARRVESSFAWEDLILPDVSKTLLKRACDQVRHRGQVYGQWGFGRKLPYGAGLSMLFSGPPGTGKTMAAQIVAGQLGLELYKVDLAAVVSKYVGETEKNLRDIFREAAKSQAVLFFDEADALFGKRTEVKEANDRYNNMEAAYLLQKIEEYEGVSVLATNYLQNLDEAFQRRLKFIIQFPFPDARYRLLLWRSAFPRETPLEGDLDWEYLAGQFELSGSGIKNVAVNAAFLAARDGRAVGMGHLLCALRQELMKSGKLLLREDFGPYYMLAEEGEAP